MALNIMRNDLVVHNGVMKARLFPYDIALIREGNTIMW